MSYTSSFFSIEANEEKKDGRGRHRKEKITSNRLHFACVNIYMHFPSGPQFHQSFFISKECNGCFVCVCVCIWLVFSMNVYSLEHTPPRTFINGNEWEITVWIALSFLHIPFCKECGLLLCTNLCMYVCMYV